MTRSFLDTLVPDRSCGECTACCRVLAIDDPDLRKDAGPLCAHSSGTGCAIYARRPEACRTWYCLWRRIDAMPEAARPDRIGVMFSIEIGEPGSGPLDELCFVGHALNGADDFAHPGAVSALRMFADSGMLAVWTSDGGGEKELVFPDPDLAAAIEDPEAHPDRAPEARRWRSRLGFA